MRMIPCRKVKLDKPGKHGYEVKFYKRFLKITRSFLKL